MRRTFALLALAVTGCAAASGNAGTAWVVRRQPAPGSCHARVHGGYALPDPRCTPGATDRRVSQANVGRTICVPGYSETVRPPEWVTEREKRASLAAYGDAGPPSGYEYDHLIPLSLGGAHNDPRNLWPEPGSSPNVKDGLEYRLHDLVCEGRMSLRAAQAGIARNWVTWWVRLGRPRA